MFLLCSFPNQQTTNTSWEPGRLDLKNGAFKHSRKSPSFVTLYMLSKVTTELCKTLWCGLVWPGVARGHLFPPHPEEWTLLGCALKFLPCTLWSPWMFGSQAWYYNTHGFGEVLDSWLSRPLEHQYSVLLRGAEGIQGSTGKGLSKRKGQGSTLCQFLAESWEFMLLTSLRLYPRVLPASQPCRRR